MPGGAAFANVGYARDPVGSRIGMTDLLTPTDGARYAYDPADRLVEIERGEPTADFSALVSPNTRGGLTQRRSWQLDDVGNWSIVETVTNLPGGGTDTVTEFRGHNAANEIAWKDVNTNHFVPGYEHNGNLVTDGTHLYEYDVENRLTRVRRAVDSAVVAEYLYDALGRRIRKVVSNSGPELEGTFVWVWGPRWDLLEIRRADGETETVEQAFVHGGPGSYLDDHVAMFAGSNTYYYHTDELFSPAALTDAAGAVVERYVLDPYGRATVFDGDWTNPRASSSIGNPFLHQGLALDAETGAYHNRFRQYHPVLGRFFQRDPLGYVDGPSLYLYVSSDPLYWLDPFGLDDLPWWVEATEFLGGDWQTEAATVGTVLIVAEVAQAPVDILYASGEPHLHSCAGPSDDASMI